MMMLVLYKKPFPSYSFAVLPPISRSETSIRNAELYTAARLVCAGSGMFEAHAGVEAITAAAKSSLLLE